MTTVRRLALPALAVFLVGCAARPAPREPAPGEPGYAFNVNGNFTGMFSVEGQTLSATMTLQTGPEGVITGEVRVTEVGITAPVEGTLARDQLTLRIGYYNPGSACNGVAQSTATVQPGGDAFAGAMTLTECGQAMSGALRFQRP